MQTSDFLMLLGGLALFLYGMQMMSSGLEAAAGNKMKTILERLTSNRFKGVLVGAGITAVIQSSSATTVMVVGFVSAGLMTLNQAVWVIMGANIGTTITGQLIALDVGAIAPLIAFIGVVMMVFLKSEKPQHIGNIIAGLGVLFIGMDMMSSAMTPLKDSEAFIKLITNFDNPFIGILAGAVFTALIQSSSASVGILQALAAGCICAFRSEYRNLYHGYFGRYRDENQRKTFDDHSSDVQYYRYGSLYLHLYGYTVCLPDGEPDSWRYGCTDRQCTYDL